MLTTTACSRQAVPIAGRHDRAVQAATSDVAMPVRRLKQAAVAVAAALSIASSAGAACPDLVTAPDGLQFCDVLEGQGETPVKGAVVKVHYEGRLDSDIASGTFDSSYDRGRPLAFSLGTGQVIKGWDLGIGGEEGVPAMKAGGKRQLVIPPQLAYGERGAGGVIPRNATLYFNVELLGRLGKK